jgi:sugar (pentulose or hexulose) kinase
MTGDEVFAGIDIGTQSLRIALVDGHGKLVGRGETRLRSRRSRGRRHEQDPENWWLALGAAGRQATAALRGRPVAAVAICSTSGTVALASADGRPLTAALMYDDMRAIEQTRRLRAVGHHIQPSWALPKLLWLVEAEQPPPGAVLMHSADFVAARLTGRRVPTDTSHALKTGYDLGADRWPVEVLEETGIPRALLPDVVAPGALLGEVTRTAAEFTGITAGARVVAGMTDGCAGQIAAGSLAQGSWTSVLGTTLVLKGVTREPVRDGHAVYSHRHPDRGWLPGGASNVGAGALAAAFPGRDLSRLDSQAAAYEPAGAVLYPLTAQGERFPFDRPDAQPLQLGSVRNEVEHYAAILQGVAFVERLGLAYFRSLGADVSGPVTLTGGASRSRYWSQLRADVLRRTVRRPRHAEASVGMAILAAADGASVTATAARMAGDAEEIDPRPDRPERFEAGYARLIDELLSRGYITPELARNA